MIVKKNDNIIVSSGKDKGKKGKVVRAFPSEGTVVVEGINLLKKRQKARKAGQKGQTITVNMPMKACAVKLFCGSCGQGVRTGSKDIGGKKVRICRKCGKEI
ncbi:MAG: 50S ribosomal protein L24 [bacterium]